MDIQGVIFDFDYTFGDATEGIVLSIRYAMGKMGYPLPDVLSIKKTVGLSLADTFSALTKNSDRDKADSFSSYFKEMADREMVKNTIVYPGAAQVARMLRENGIKTGIVSNKFRYRIEQILSRFDLQNDIDRIIGAEDVTCQKPDPEGLLKMVQQLQTDKSKTLYVGDSLVDAETAERADTSFIGVLTGTTTREDFAMYKHTAIVREIGDLQHELQELFE